MYFVPPSHRQWLPPDQRGEFAKHFRVGMGGCAPCAARTQGLGASDIYSTAGPVTRGILIGASILGIVALVGAFIWIGREVTD